MNTAVFFLQFFYNEYPSHLEKQTLKYPTPHMIHQVLCYFLSHNSETLIMGWNTVDFKSLYSVLP